MRDRVRLVAAAGVGDPEVAKFGHREVPAVEAVDDGCARTGSMARMAATVRRMTAAWFSRVKPYIPMGGGLLTRSKLSATSGTPAYRRANPSHRKTKASWASSCMGPQVVLLEGRCG